MRINGNHHINEQEIPFVKSPKECLSIVDMVVIIFKIAVDTYGLTVGYLFRTGIVLAMLVNTVMAYFSYRSMMIYLKTAYYYKCSTYEEIWEKVFPRTTSSIQSFISLYQSEVYIMSYLQSILELYDHVLPSLSENLPELFFTPYVPLLILIAIYYLPANMTTSFKSVTFSCYSAFLIYIYLIIHAIYWFVVYYKENGIDPNNEIVYFKWGRITLDCITSFSSSYSFVPLVYPGFQHLSNPTYLRWRRVFRIEHLLAYVVYTGLGLLGIFTFYNSANGELNIQLYPMCTLVQITFFLAILMVTFTTIVSLNPAKYLIFSTFIKCKSVDKGYMRYCGIVLIIFAMFGATLSDKITTWIYFLNSVFLYYLLFIIPCVFYLKIPNNDKFFEKVECVFFIIFGLVFMGLTVYMQYDSIVNVE